MSDLFSSPASPPLPPLADRLRPQRLADVVGQDHLLGPQGGLRRLLDAGALPSLIFWGPPGTGKTSIARLLAQEVGLVFAPLSAVFSGVADLKKAFEEARLRQRMGQRTLLFIDEIHRFNRAQQDAFLPVVEEGTLTLVGATTENPSFELNAALLSRCQLLVLHRLDAAALEILLQRAETLADQPLPLTPDARAALCHQADGDGRFLLGASETLLALHLPAPLTIPELATTLQRRMPVYDKDREGHYGLISALHKSLRGSDVDAALYYAARMLVAGEDPLYLLRRLVRFASEDIGLADPNALVQALAAKDAYDLLGSPEGELAITQAVIYLATAPKSIGAYAAHKAAMALARSSGSLTPPLNILNAPTGLMKKLGYGTDYAYDPDCPDSFSGANYWPDTLPAQQLYHPAERGFERDIAKRLDWWAKQRTLRREEGE